MMTKVLVGILSLGVTLAAASAWAEEDQAKDRVIHEPDQVIIQETTTVDFNEAQIDGELTRPEGSYVPGRERARFDSLLKPRTDFFPELEESTMKEGM